VLPRELPFKQLPQPLRIAHRAPFEIVVEVHSYIIAGGLALNLHHFWGHIERAAVPIQAAGTFAFVVSIACAFWVIIAIFLRYFP